MIHCLLSPLRDRLHSFFAGDLYPEHDSLDDELAELRDRCVNYEQRIDRLTCKNAVLLRRAEQAETQVDALSQQVADLLGAGLAMQKERDRAVIDLRDVLSLRGGTHPSELIERDDQ